MTLSARIPIGRDSTWYKLTGGSGKVLLEFEIYANGRRIDYLKLDAFWG
jgi:hypothetical protein